MTRRPLPQAEYEAIYSRVPRLTVELVIAGEQGVLMTRRAFGPCAGLWHLPGGTVRYGEPLVEAVARVGLAELGVALGAGELLGAIEYPSHLAAGIDWPVGLAFRCTTPEGELLATEVRRWFASLPDEMHDEQRQFLDDQGLVARR